MARKQLFRFPRKGSAKGFGIQQFESNLRQFIFAADLKPDAFSQQKFRMGSEVVNMRTKKDWDAVQDRLHDVVPAPLDQTAPNKGYCC